MRLNPKYMTAGVTVFAAAATAHLMQSSNGPGPSTVLESVTPAQAGVVTPMPAANAAGPMAEVTDVVPVAASTDIAPHSVESAMPDMPRPPRPAVVAEPLPDHGTGLARRMAVVDTAPAAPAPDLNKVERNEFGLSCGAMLTATGSDAAMMSLTLTAPCRGGQAFTVRHGDLVYSARMSDLGTYMAEVPALTAEARVKVTFRDGSYTTAEAHVPLADTVDRVALVSDRRSGLQIHALEFGADYGDAGHVWSGRPRDPASADKAGGGFVTVLGDASIEDGQMTEVYTFPANTRNRDGVVRLSVEAEVTAENCDRDITGRTLQRQADGSIKPVTLTLALPACDAVGEFLVLKNLLRDLRIASN